MRKNHFVILGSMLIMTLLVGTAYAQSTTSSVGMFSGIGELLTEVFLAMLSIFKLEFMGHSRSDLVALMRFFIWVMMFAIFHTVTNAIFNKSTTTGGTNRLPIVISFALASITAIFSPESVLLAIGIEYSSILLTIILIALPVAILYLAYVQYHPTTRMEHLIRVLAILICLWVLNEVSLFVNSPTGFGTPIFFLVPEFLVKRFYRRGERK